MPNCPRCGEDTDRLYEGYCEGCRDSGQSALDAHNAEHDRWSALSEKEREAAIHDAARGL